MPNKLGEGQGPAAPAHPAQKYLTSKLVMDRQAELIELHGLEIKNLESPIEQLKAGIAIAAPFLEMLAIPANVAVPGSGEAIRAILKDLEERANA